MPADSLRRVLAAQLDELRGNPRLRIGLWLIVAILLLLVILNTRDAVVAARGEHRQLRERLAEVDALAGSEETWSERLKAARALRVEIESQMWYAGSPGLAQASFQSWLQRTAESSTIGNLRVTMHDVRELELANAHWQVTASLTATFQPEQLKSFLYEIERHVPVAVIESMTVRNDRNRTLQMTVSALFQRQEPG